MKEKIEVDYSKFNGYDMFENAVCVNNIVVAPFGDNNDLTPFKVIRVLPNWSGKYGNGGALLLKLHNSINKDWSKWNKKDTTVRVYSQVLKITDDQFMPYLLSI